LRRFNSLGSDEFLFLMRRNCYAARPSARPTTLRESGSPRASVEVIADDTHDRSGGYQTII
jgi:hypothetical protein